MGETTTTFDRNGRDADGTYERGGHSSLTNALVEAIADHEGADPLDLDFSLYDSLDADLLDSLLASASGTELCTEFRVSDLLVAVRKSEGDEVSIHVRTAKRD